MLKQKHSFFQTPLFNQRLRSVDSYRYTYNGKELDKDFGSSYYDFGARIYDGRIARWLAVDAMFDRLPNESPYTGLGNNPIIYKDKDGNIAIPIIFWIAAIGIEEILTIATVGTTAIIVTDVSLHGMTYKLDGGIDVSKLKPGVIQPLPLRFYGQKPVGQNDPNFKFNNPRGWGKVGLGLIATYFASRLATRKNNDRTNVESISNIDIAKGYLKSVINYFDKNNLSIDEGKSKPSEIGIIKVIEKTFDVRAKIQEGQTVSELAEKYNTTVENIVELNGLKDKNNIKAGETLIIDRIFVSTSLIPSKNGAYEATIDIKNYQEQKEFEESIPAIKEYTEKIEIKK